MSAKIRNSGKFPQHVGVRLSVSLRLALAWLCSALIITTAPLNFGPPADGRGYLQNAFLYGDFERSFSHVALNVLLFVPLGVLLHHEGVRRRLPASRTAVLTVTIGLLISVVVESLQVFLPDRDSSLFDVGANTMGAIVGVIANRIAGQSIEQLVNRWYSQTTPRKLAGVMAGFLLVALGFASACLSGVLATELPAYNSAYLALLSLPSCVLVAVFARTARERHLFGALWIASFSVLLELTLVTATGRAFDPANIVKTSAVATLVLAGSVATLAHSARGRHRLVAGT